MLRRVSGWGCLLLLLLSADTLFAQPLSAFVDIQNQLMVWDKGMIRKIDFMPPTDMKIGRIAIPFLDNSRSFKIYYAGGVRNINAGFTNSYYATDNLVVYLNQKSINVYDKGNTKNLTGICEQYIIGDSVVLFLDGVKSEYRAYYNGQLYTLETYVPDSVLSGVKVSDNIIGYNNFANQFRIFYRGLVIAQEDFPVVSFDAGRNTVAYVDNNRQFKIFHNGKTMQVEDYAPQNYAVGDNLVAYVSSDGYFKIFYGDTVRSFGYGSPLYQVGDNVVGFKDADGIFKAFYKGIVTDLESYYPNNYTVQYNSIAYVNSSSTLRLFTEGEVYDVTNSELDSWQLNYDVIKYQIGQSIFKIFYKGTEY